MILLKIFINYFAVINILKLYNVAELLKNNCTNKAVFISSEGHNKCTPLFSTEPTFRNGKFQPVKISQVPKGSGYKNIVAGKEVSLKGVPISVVNLFTKQTFTGNDVIKWLLEFGWGTDIVSLLSPLVVQSIIFVETNSGEQSDKREIVANHTISLRNILCFKNRLISTDR